MTKKHHKVAEVGLGVLFGLLIVGYSFFQPFQAGQTKMAIPAGGPSPYKVESLNELIHSPLCSQLDKSFRTNFSIERFSASHWTSLAAPSEIAVIDFPARSSNGDQIWVAASWVGWRSPWLRWKLDHYKDEKLSYLGKHATWPIWRYNLPGPNGSDSIIIALTDNVLISCLSDNPTYIFTFLDTYDGKLPSVASNEG